MLNVIVYTEGPLFMQPVFMLCSMLEHGMHHIKHEGCIFFFPFSLCKFDLIYTVADVISVKVFLHVCEFACLLMCHT